MKINGAEVKTIEQLKAMFRKEIKALTQTDNGWPVVCVANVSAYGNDSERYGYELKEGDYEAFYHHFGRNLKFKISDQEFEYECSNLTGYGTPTDWYIDYHQDGEIINETTDEDGWPLVERADRKEIPVEKIKAAAWVAANEWVAENA